LTPDEAIKHGIQINRDGVRRSAYMLLSYPDVRLANLAAIWPDLGNYSRSIADQVEIDAKYKVYLDRQSGAALSLKRDEGVFLGADIDYDRIPGLSNEVRARLKSSLPETLGQASRLEGVTPAALTLLLACIRKNLARRNACPMAGS
jgi:tRNA uridine 5-carboxymethylaminomethyl modification enzyme